MSCIDKTNSACPFAWTEASEQAQSYGCLPSMYDITLMRTKYNKTWACHDDIHKPCIGAIRELKERGLPYSIIDTVLVTVNDDWSSYVQ